MVWAVALGELRWGELEARGPGGARPLGVLLYEPVDRELDYVVDFQHLSMEAGYVSAIPGV